MADINIPGVSDKYKTKDLIAGLVEAEKIPLKREQDKLDGYKDAQQNWRRVNQYMGSLRESARTLFSFNNPFNEKVAVSTNEAAVTATAGREAQLQPFKVQVLSTASADRFLSADLDKNHTVPAGTYTFESGDKSAAVNWRGGTLTDFVSALNKRSNNVVKASLVSINGTTRTLLLEAQKTGEASGLVFKDDALKFALDTALIKKGKTVSGAPLTLSQANLAAISGMDSTGVRLSGGSVLIAPENAIDIVIPEQAKKADNAITFTVAFKEVQVKEKPAPVTEPVLPQGGVHYKGISVQNAVSDADLPPLEPLELPTVVDTESVVYVKNTDGTIHPLPLGTDGSVRINFSDYPLLSSIEIKNENTAKQVTLSQFQSIASSETGSYEPVNPIDRARDAIFTYEGIKMTRPTNKIDDAVPHMTLNLHGVTQQPAMVNVEHNIQAAKDAVISFVGNYNQLMAEINILTQNKPEVIAELDYLTQDEKDEAKKRLGIMMSDFTLNNGKQNLQRALTAPYVAVDESAIKLLSDLGIAGKTAAGAGINPAQLRGYLEIDEKKLDTALKDSMSDIKNLFGFDANGDMVIDNGLAFQVEKQLQSYTQVGGVIASRTMGLDSKIKSSETQIKRLETQVAAKEAELKRKYGQMESTLSSLGSQSAAISNFSNQNSGPKN